MNKYAVITLSLVIASGFFLFQKNIQEITKSTLSNPKQTPASRHKYLVVNKSFKNTQGTYDNYLLIDQSGKTIKTLIPPGRVGRDRGVRISPDYNYLAFNSWDSPENNSGCGVSVGVPCPEGKYGLKIRNLQTGEESYIHSPTSEGTSFPYFSIDGKKIAYSTAGKTYIYSIEDKKSSKIADYSSQESIYWIKDSKNLYLTDGATLYLVYYDGKNPQKISPAAFPKVQSSKFLDVSSDNKYLVVNRMDGYYSMGPAGQNPRKIFNNDQNTQFSGIVKKTNKAIFATSTPSIKGQQNYDQKDKSEIIAYDLETNQFETVLSGKDYFVYIPPEDYIFAFTDYLDSPEMHYYIYYLPSRSGSTFLEGITAIVDWP